MAKERAKSEMRKNRQLPLIPVSFAWGSLVFSIFSWPLVKIPGLEGMGLFLGAFALSRLQPEVKRERIIAWVGCVICGSKLLIYAGYWIFILSVLGYAYWESGGQVR